MRIILLGNAGSGKSTMARRLVGNASIPRLSLDAIAWDEGTARRPIEDSLADLYRFMGMHDQWVMEGCYGDLVEAALPRCTELRFLNPGVAVCVAHCRSRPWEPDKFPSPQAQQAMLESLIEWVLRYETRDDEYGLSCHRRIFDAFAGRKREFTSLASYEA